MQKNLKEMLKIRRSSSNVRLDPVESSRKGKGSESVAPPNNRTRFRQYRKENEDLHSRLKELNEKLDGFLYKNKTQKTKRQNDQSPEDFLRKLVKKSQYYK